MRLQRAAIVIAVLALILQPLHSAQAGVIVGSSNTRVTDSNQLDAWVGEPDLASRGNTLYATWRDARRTDSQTEADIVFSSSTDGGATWGPNLIVSDSQYVGFTNNPAISVSPDGTIWIAWGLDACYDIDITCGGASLLNDVRVAWSFNGGQTWSESGLWNGTPGSISDPLIQRPQIVATDGKIWTLLHDPTFSGGNLIGFDIVLHEITRSGSSLTPSFTLLTPTSSGKVNNVEGPITALAVNGNVVCAAWEDQRDGSSIYGTCSTNGAASFPAGNRWSTNGADTAPRLAFAADGRLYLSYRDVDKKDIVVRTSTDNGVSWSTPRAATNIGSAYTFDYDLTIAPDGQLVMPVVVGALSTAPETDLNVVTSIDGGQTFSVNGPVEAGNEPYLGIATQYRVAVAATGGAGDARAHFVWSDDRGNPLVVQDLIWSATAVLDSLPPTMPANLRATGGDTSVLLEWDASSDASGVGAYHVERAGVSGGPFTRINALPVTQPYYRDVGLGAGTYVYRVIAVDVTGNASTPSAEASGTASVGGPLSGLNGTLAYDRGGSSIGVRPLTAGVAGSESLITGSLPAYSTNGQRLYVRSTAAGLGTVMAGDVNGQNAQIAFTEPQAIGEFDLPASDNYVAGVFQDDYNGACVPFEARLLQITPRSTQVSTSNTNAASISVSPDHRWVAYANRLYCTLAGTTTYDSNRLCLIDTQAVAFTETCQAPANVQGSDFGNSGNVLVMSANYSGQNEIWRATVTGSGGLSNITQLTRGAAGQPSTRPRVSSDGNWVAFLRDIDPGTGENLQVHVVRLDGDGVRSLGFGAASIVWSGGGPAGPLVGFQRLFLPLVRR